MWQDVRYAVRSLRKAPGFTAVAVLTLSLGIGANTAIFSVIQALLLRPLPVPRADELVQLFLVRPEQRPANAFSYPFVKALAGRREIFDGVFGFVATTMTVDLDQADGAWVTGEYYDTLGLVPAAGRLLTPDDDRPGAAPVVVITDGYWKRRFGGDPSAIGRTIRVYGVPAGQKRDLIAFFRRVNDDYHARRSDTDYQDGEVVYGYLDLNCAKTIGMGFKRGAGYEDLVVKGAPVLAIRKLKAALKANIPTEMAMKLVKQWVARGYRMDVVLYRKYDGSTYVDPHEEEAVEFRNLPDRFPSVLSRDFRREGGAYKDYDNLYAMYLLDNMRKYTVTLNDESGLEIETRKAPMGYLAASELAAKKARADSRTIRKRG